MDIPLKLLLLEDDPTDAELIQRMLQRAGLQFNAIVASNEKEFLEAMKGNGYHAVLADNALPQYSSMEALKLIRATNPYVAFILVTGTVSEEFAVNIIQQGADDYILKTNLTRLPAAVTNAIAKKRIQYEKEMAVKEVEKEKELSISIINSLPGIFYLCDKNGRFLRWNKNLERISGYPASAINGMAMEDFFTDDDKDHIRQYMEKSFANGYGEIESLLVTKDGKKIPYYFTCTAVKFEHKDCLIGAGLDISASKQSETALKQLNEELHSVSAHLERIREEEQARIAREVHDQLGQQLTGLKMDLSWLQRKCGEKTGMAEINDKLKEMAGMLDEAVRAVRKVASDLRPSILDDFGLVQVLDWHSTEFSKRSGIAVQFRHPENELIINNDITIGLFRIYQEVLTNVARHAEAKNVITTLAYLPDHLLLTIADDGKGFDANKKQKSLGLLGMRERAYIIGGTVTINSDPGIGGTTVIVTVPL